MNRSFNLRIVAVVLLTSLSAYAAGLPADWQHDQSFDVPAAGLLKLSLPPATLNAARPALEDLRIYDDNGNEVSYVVERPVPVAPVTRGAKSFQATLNSTTTVLTIETGLAQPIDAVTLQSPASGFIKPVKLEGSDDGRRWQVLGQGLPVFRRFGGVERLQLPVPVGKWPWLRITVDDQRSPPVPFTGAIVHAATSEAAPSETVPATIAERHENPGETRLTLDLGTANADLVSVQIDTDEPLFTRQVTLAVPQVREDSIYEQTVAQGVVYRVAIEGQPASANLSVPLGSQVQSRELLLLIENQDSAPLAIKSVQVERRPVYVVFMAGQAGHYHVLTGNSRCAAPRYDLAALSANFKNTSVSPVTLSPLADNASYHPPEVLPGMPSDGIALDVSAWKFRQAVNLARDGAQQLELGLDVLAHAQSDLADLRLLRDGKQIPYIVEHTSITRALTPTVTVTNDTRDKTLTRWTLKLPQSNLPILRLVCTSPTALFQRDLTLYEELTDERGAKYQRALGSATWVQTPDAAKKEFVFTVNDLIRSDTVFLETHNGDNPPIELAQFRMYYPVTRLLFKATAADGVFLYYDNSQASPPRYDLSLVAGQLLAAQKSPVTLAAPEPLRKSTWAESRSAGQGGVIFWSILAVVVVVLLVVISRLLPKPKP